MLLIFMSVYFSKETLLGVYSLLHFYLDRMLCVSLTSVNPYFHVNLGAIVVSRKTTIGLKAQAKAMERRK